MPGELQLHAWPSTAQGAFMPRGSSSAGVESPLAAPPQLASRVSTKTTPSAHPASQRGEAPPGGHGPMAQFPGLRVGHRCGRPHGFKRIQLAVPRGRTGRTRRQPAADGVSAAAAALDAEFEGGLPAGVRAPTVAGGLLLGWLRPQSNRAGPWQRQGRPWPCQIRRPAAPEIRDC